MKTPPAFQFYPDDFLSGTMDMTQAEVGAYIRLLCWQWNHGSIPSDPDALKRIAFGQVSERVRLKFKRGKNQKLEAVRERQQEYRDKQRVKGQASAKARFNRGSTAVQPSGEPDGQPKVNSPSPSPSSSTEHERESGNFAERPDLKEVLAHAATIGLAPWKAEDWFNEMEACGWKDFQHRDVANWQALERRVKAKWEADGRPKGPPTSNTNGQPVTLKTGPLRPDVVAYFREKGDEHGSYAVSWYGQWAKRGWKKHGASIDWKAQASEDWALYGKPKLPGPTLDELKSSLEWQESQKVKDQAAIDSLKKRIAGLNEQLAGMA